VKRTLATPVKVTEGGRVRKKSTQEIALMVLREKALHGDTRALDRLLDLAARFNNDIAEVGSAQPLPAEDQAILDAFAAECESAEVSQGSDTDPLDDSAPKSRTGAGKKAPE
jgi:hypothetical protein